MSILSYELAYTRSVTRKYGRETRKYKVGDTTMSDLVYVGIDVSKDSLAVALIDGEATLLARATESVWL